LATDKMDDAAFCRELRGGGHGFEHILGQHAAVMADAAHPALCQAQQSAYMALGARLGDVQHAWTNHLCGALDDHVDDKHYRRVVHRLISGFNGRLIEMLTAKDDTVVQPAELMTKLARAHSMQSARAERAMARTAQLFNSYVAHLSCMYQAETLARYRVAALNTLHVAQALGAWLDATVFE
jgi:hypothetical protein